MTARGLAGDLAFAAEALGLPGLAESLGDPALLAKGAAGAALAYAAALSLLLAG